MKCDESVAEAHKTAIFRSLPRFKADRVVFGLIFMRPVFQEEALLLFNLILAGSSRNLKVLTFSEKVRLNFAMESSL